MTEEADSFDKLNQEFSKYLMQLKKEKAFQSIFLLSEAYVAIVKQFHVNADEYLYYLYKWRDSEHSDFDLSQTEIVLYLKSIIERLEGIYNQKIEASSLELLSPEPSHEERADSVPIEENRSEYPESRKEPVALNESGIVSSVGVEHITLEPASDSEWQEITLDNTTHTSASQPSASSHGDRDLNAILNALDDTSPIEPKKGIHISPSSEYVVVKPLKAFGFEETIPKFLSKE